MILVLRTDILRPNTIYSDCKHKHDKIMNNADIQCHGNYIQIKRKSIICFNLKFYEIPCKTFWCHEGWFLRDGCPYVTALLAKTTISTFLQVSIPKSNLLYYFITLGPSGYL